MLLKNTKLQYCMCMLCAYTLDYFTQMPLYNDPKTIVVLNIFIFEVKCIFFEWQFLKFVSSVRNNHAKNVKLCMIQHILT